MKASILAIGTELTSGQITNKNASTLSQKLREFGVDVAVHLTVPDTKSLILEALDFISNKSELIFITGGLGPTSDDFTRDVIAEWTASEMVFDETSWTQIQERLSSRGFTVREMQKQQCYFPKASKILHNREGTANGFQMTLSNRQNLELFILPGPPREIEAIWKDHIHSYLKNKTENLNRLITKSWDTLGLGESDVAYKVKSVTDNLNSDIFFDLGYRVHLPYVEVKFSYYEKDQNQFEQIVTDIDRTIKDITVIKDFKDIVNEITTRLTGSEFVFYDFLTEGYLHNRLAPELRRLKNWSFKQAPRATSSTVSADFFQGEDGFLALIPVDDISACVLLSHNGKFQQKVIEPPMKSPLMDERRRQFCAEIALLELYRCVIS